jgi:hypothetical protein
MSEHAEIGRDFAHERPVPTAREAVNRRGNGARAGLLFVGILVTYAVMYALPIYLAVRALTA